MRSLVLVILLALASPGCVREPYTQVAPVRFSPGAPAGVTFPALIQHATALGYVLDAVDPMRGMFAVHSRMLGRPPRGGRRGYGPMRSNLFVVHVQEGEVRVTAIGRHVSEDGSMHPTLAQELEIFGDSMRRAASAVTSAMTSGGAMPAPPSAYGAPAAPAYGAPGQAPPSAYGAPPDTPPPAYGAPPEAQPPSRGTPVQPPSAYDAPPTAQPPPAYGAPTSPQAPPSYGAQPSSEPAPPSPPAAGPPPSPARRLGDPQP